MSTRRSFGLDSDDEFCRAYMRAGGYLQKYYEDDYERVSNRIKRKRAKPAVPLWDWDQTYEVREPGNGWNFPRILPDQKLARSLKFVNDFINSNK